MPMSKRRLIFMEYTVFFVQCLKDTPQRAWGQPVKVGAASLFILIVSALEKVLGGLQP